jgi:catechol 2,3-dioxygenase-like lactoylglutathione lyase family enzyme
MSKDTIDHFAIAVADLNAASQWYQTSFKCEEIYRDTKQIILQFENIKLALVLPSQERPHLAIERSDADTFGSLRDLASGVKSCFISDPTGNPVELIQVDDNE